MDVRPNKCSFKIPSIRTIRSFQKKIFKWHKTYGRYFPWRKKSATKYEKIISEILLQRTRAETVASFFPIFIKNYPSWKSLANADEEELRTHLKPIGLWKRRAKSLFDLAKQMSKRKGRFPKNREEAELLPGVGQYITNAIFLFCHEKPEPLLDANMARILERYFGPRKLVDIRYDPYLQKLSRIVLPSENTKEFNWAILDFAVLVCKIRNPDCGSCCLNKNCQYFSKRQINRKTSS